MANGTPTQTSLPQAWAFLMNTLGQFNYVRTQQALQNQRVLNNFMAGRPVWK